MHTNMILNKVNVVQNLFLLYVERGERERERESEREKEKEILLIIILTFEVYVGWKSA